MLRLVALVLFCVRCATLCGQLHTEPNPPNSPAAEKAHYVVLVSLDGFRYDYPRLYGAPHLVALGQRGISVPDGMRPSYPSVTFPNHYTLVTGLVPEHHGIVENRFLDPATGKVFTMANTDGSMWGGVPLWSLAEQQGMRAADFFWPGSEGKIAGKRPSYWMHFDDKFPNEKRIEQVVEWLKLPEAERPHLITLYYSNVDHAGHVYGPNAPETRDAVHLLDGLVGELDEKLQALHMPIDLVVVADHGMLSTKGDWVNLDEIPWLAPLLKGIRHEDTLLYPETDAQAQAIVDASRAHPDPRFKFYRRKDVPKSLQYRDNPREGDPVLVPTPGYAIRYSAGKSKATAGYHGWDPKKVPEMRAIFYAAGPDVRQGVKLKTFQNVDVYDFVAGLLHLTPAPNDGTLKPFKKALVHP